MPEPDRKAIGDWARFGAVGFEFAGTIVSCLLAGYYADAYIGTAPLFTLLLTVGGMAGALYRLLWMLKRSDDRNGDGN